VSTTRTYHDTYKHVTRIAGVPSSQALPGSLITAPQSVCVPDVIGALAVWIQNQKKCFTDTLPTNLHAHASAPRVAGVTTYVNAKIIVVSR